MGIAAPWQDQVAQSLKNTDLVLLNPRRANWDDSWEQTINNPEFKRQVEWELNGIERADQVLMYFDPATKSPISLLELGFIAGRNKEIMVVCPDGFWRKGNVEVVCAKYGLRMLDSLESAIKEFLNY